MADKPGVLGMRPARKFKILREEFPAIIRFNGKLFQEFYDIDADKWCLTEITEKQAKPWLEAKKP
jgi:hypothetical protein